VLQISQCKISMANTHHRLRGGGIHYRDYCLACNKFVELNLASRVAGFLFAVD
jgi:hypothetical protein